MLIKLAWRNLWRNQRRSLITGGAVAWGLAMLIFSSGVGEGVISGMLARGIGAAAGTVVVQGPGWQDERKVEMVVPDSGAVASRVAADLPEAVITRRIFVRGLLTSPSGSSSVSLTAVDPGPEGEVNDVTDQIVEGSFFGEGDSSNGIVLGRTLAESLDVELGDKVVLLAKGPGEMESQLFRVTGVFASGLDDIDGFCGYVRLGAAQEMLGLGDGAHQVGAHLSGVRGTRAAVRAVDAAVAAEELEVLSWQDALPQLHEYTSFYRVQTYIAFLVMFAMIGLGIVNTVLMSVLERMREFGVMMALGTSPRRLAALVLTEAALLGAVATGLGVVLGVLMNWPMAVYGMDFAQFFGGDTVEVAGFALVTTLYADLDPLKVVIFALTVWTVTTAAAIYPAVKAAALTPIDCLHHQ